MITGVVSPYREPVIRLQLRGPGGRVEVDTVVDTGFTDFLTLPPALVGRLALPLGGSMRVALADGSEVDLDVYTVEVLWDGRVLSVPALEADGGLLAGMSLLHGHELPMQVVDGGQVTIQALP